MSWLVTGKAGRFFFFFFFGNHPQAETYKQNSVWTTSLEQMFWRKDNSVFFGGGIKDGFANVLANILVSFRTMPRASRAFHVFYLFLHSTRVRRCFKKCFTNTLWLDWTGLEYPACRYFLSRCVLFSEVINETFAVQKLKKKKIRSYPVNRIIKALSWLTCTSAEVLISDADFFHFASLWMAKCEGRLLSPRIPVSRILEDI